MGVAVHHQAAGVSLSLGDGLSGSSRGPPSLRGRGYCPVGSEYARVTSQHHKSWRAAEACARCAPTSARPNVHMVPPNSVRGRETMKNASRQHRESRRGDGRHLLRLKMVVFQLDCAHQRAIPSVKSLEHGHDAKRHQRTGCGGRRAQPRASSTGTRFGCDS